MRTAVLMLALMCWSATPAAAQCCGDCNGDGEVSVNDLITAVNNALGGCPGGTPTKGKTATPTTKPSATPSNRCADAFTDDLSNATSACGFNGPFSGGCGGNLASAFTSNGTLLVALIDTNPVVGFGATVQSATTAALVGWSSDNFAHTTPVSGQIRLENGGAQLIIAPGSAPFTVDGCSLSLYTGAYTGRISGGKRDAGDAGAALQRLEAWTQRPLPDLQPGR
jgi:hypothetical protein